VHRFYLILAIDRNVSSSLPLRALGWWMRCDSASCRRLEIAGRNGKMSGSAVPGDGGHRKHLHHRNKLNLNSGPQY
jgi:hypothetical protein